MKQAAEPGDHLTRDMLRAELKNLVASLIRRALGITDFAIAALRLPG